MRDASTRGAQTSGSGFTDWGAGIGFEFLLQKPYDASHYAGVSFWIRGFDDNHAIVHFGLPDRDTSAFGHVCDNTKGACFDDFGTNVTLTEEWQHVELRWAEMTQVGWSPSVDPSIQLPDAIVPQELYGVRFQATEESVEFHFMVDDVAFLCDP